MTSTDTAALTATAPREGHHYLVRSGAGKAVHLYEALRVTETNPTGLGYTYCGAAGPFTPAPAGSTSTCRSCAARRD